MRKSHFLDWDGRQVLAIYDGMNEANEQAIRALEFDELCLFAGDFPDLSGFADLAGRISRLTISSGVGVCDLESLAHLKALKYLRIADGIEPASKGQKLDFAAFAELEECAISWKEYFSPALLECPALRSLAFWHCAAKDLEPLSKARQLTSLSLIQGGLVDLRGIEHLQSLHSLTLAHLRNLNDISAISQLRELRHIQVTKCPKVGELAPINSLSKLEVLHVDGKFEFEDLEFLRNFPNLKEFIFDSQVKKHDFSPLFDLRALRLGRFISLRNFVAKPEELQQLAQAKRRELNLELIGGGKIKTATFEFAA
jgi:hypothetical protein